MYYLKYRPRTIAELDNSQVSKSISNILKSKDLPHAFLFIGPKGMGKTSTARIFAKAVNCEKNMFAGKGESIEPCNTCGNCMAIDTSSSPDVMEMDAASNRGIDEIKSLIKESVFAPMTGKYRVFIIDEAHMITNDAFNALLKTLEEPPESVIFILATTNEEKVPATIQSRCFKVTFGSAQRDDVLHQLKRITDGEKLTITPDVLEFIVQYSESSFRDAAKLLEELVIQNKLTIADAESYLGIRAKQNLLHIMKNQPLTESLKWIDEFIDNGGSIKFVLEEMLLLLRKQLLIKSKATADTKDDLGYSLAETAALLKLFTEAYGNLRISPLPSVPLEIAVVEFYNRSK